MELHKMCKTTNDEPDGGVQDLPRPSVRVVREDVLHGGIPTLFRLPARGEGSGPNLHLGPWRSSPGVA